MNINLIIKCLFKLVRDGKIHGYLGVHVDDVLCTGHGEVFDAAIVHLKQHFKFGSWENAQEKCIVYCGCEITQQDDFSISVKQERFSKNPAEIPLSAERRQDVQAEITLEEKTSMRQRLGGLNWAATQTQPWLLATVSVLQGCVENGVVGDILATNKLIRLQRKHDSKGLFFPVLSGPVTVITFTDASWATRRDGSSQGGQLTLVMGADVLKGAKTLFHVLSWNSRRLRRVARSSTSAETQMTANALDLHEFAKLALYDMQTVELVDLRKSSNHSFGFCL